MFIFYTIFMARKENKEENIEEEERKTTLFKDILSIIIGIVALKVGGDLTVRYAVKVAEFFNVSEKIISITILAIGTSLPELVTSVSASIKGKSDIAIGNILGSNIFNMLLIIGTSSIITPIIYNLSYNKDLFVLIFATILLSIFTIIPPKNKMSRVNGAIYTFIYIEYMMFLLMS